MTRRRHAAAVVALASDEPVEEVDYFLDPRVQTFSSGCTALDMALGGGWPERRMFNIVGDKSTGKTLLAIEACTQFLLKHPDGQIVFCEVEAAFDKEYAAALGMPVDRVRFISDEWLVCAKKKKKTDDELEGEDDEPAKSSTTKKKKKVKTWRVHPDSFDEEKEQIISDGIYTVQQLEDCLSEVLDTSTTPTLFIVDSYDALSDDAELARDASESDGWGLSKAKQGSAMFRKLNQKLSKSNVTFGIVSQVRANIGVTFGRKSTRSGGRALDFYATHVVWLAKVANITKTRNKIKRVHGVRILAKVDKNKIGLPFREAEFDLVFGYGVEDLLCSVRWLLLHNKWDKLFEKKAEAPALMNGIDGLDAESYCNWLSDSVEALQEAWREVEATFLPKRKKYAISGKQQTKGR